MSSARRIRIALAGMGKIARDQHLHALQDHGGFELVAVASPHSRLAGVPGFISIEALLDAVPDVHAIAVCTSPQVRYQVARHALERGCHVLLEKPPCATVSEAAALVEIAQRSRLALFATWHSREAPAVEAAREWLAQRTPRKVSVTWKEDVRVWHPGQDWIFEAGGLGVFDPGINALSILTRILPKPVTLRSAELFFPANRAAPIAAHVHLTAGQNTPIRMELDFLQTGPQSWDIEVDTGADIMRLSKGGAELRLNGELKFAGEEREYPNLYARFATLVHERSIDADLAPLQLVADAFLSGQRRVVGEFRF